MNLWDNNIEIEFFKNEFKKATPFDKIFYKLESEYYAYVSKKEKGKGQTLQSRNSSIGKFTEEWTKKLFEPIAKKMNLFAVNGVLCEELGLTDKSNADFALCTTEDIKQIPENIKFLFEIKMSIVSNYRLVKPDSVEYIGDYKSHKGKPSLLRSDSMLKAIGKAITVRASGPSSSSIPIIILGNSPIMYSYVKKVDNLKQAGIIQGFWSLNPKPTMSDCIKESPNRGFMTVNKINDLYILARNLHDENMNYYPFTISKPKLGQLITNTSKETTDELKADKFIKLLREI